MKKRFWWNWWVPLIAAALAVAAWCQIFVWQRPWPKGFDQAHKWAIRTVGLPTLVVLWFLIAAARGGATPSKGSSPARTIAPAPPSSSSSSGRSPAIYTFMAVFVARLVAVSAARALTSGSDTPPLHRRGGPRRPHRRRGPRPGARRGPRAVRRGRCERLHAGPRARRRAGRPAQHRAVAAPGRTLYPSNLVLDESRLSPAASVRNDALLVSFYDHGQVHTEGEFRAWLAEASVAEVTREADVAGLPLIRACGSALRTH